MLEYLKAIDPDLILAVMSIIAGFFGKPLINVIKDLFKWEDKQAVWTATGVSLALGLLVVFAGGEFSGATVDLPTIGAAWSAVFTVATLFYKVFWNEPEVKS